MPSKAALRLFHVRSWRDVRLKVSTVGLSEGSTRSSPDFPSPRAAATIVEALERARRGLRLERGLPLRGPASSSLVGTVSIPARVCSPTPVYGIPELSRERNRRPQIVAVVPLAIPPGASRARPLVRAAASATGRSSSTPSPSASVPPSREDYLLFAKSGRTRAYVWDLHRHCPDIEQSLRARGGHAAIVFRHICCPSAFESSARSTSR